MTLSTVTELANAKLNLCLYVGAPRSDSYHDIFSVMTCVSFCDTLEIKRTDKMSVASKTFLPPGDGNIAYRAMQTYFERTGIASGAHITIKKHIPVGGGLAGGSADAAAVLRGLNRLFDGAMSDDEMNLAAASLGADVPFCLYSTPALAEGIGEKLTGLYIKTPLNIVIAIPSFHASTKRMFAKLDTMPERPTDTARAKDGCKRMIEALGDADMPEILSSLHNDFTLCYEQNSEYEFICRQLLKSGSLSCMVSGSGSCIFGIYPDAKSALNACEALNKKKVRAIKCETI
ncbi:MAG TPA: 4-(cytidine 5'-diphospho)-2-C-methyl-D-erythritol kinase [Bacillota bacterium]|nr:4-(cytidine 5'-diphospho)-2-C-methyl-D-erythritol kinase [Bacillota bacterium]